MPFKNKKILVIDDTASIRTFLRISLQTDGADYYESETADQGVKICHSIHPDLVILDLGLPGRNGLEIIAELKQHANLPFAPIVIILSVNKEQHIKDKAYQLGADAYVTKPFLMENLLKLIKSVLKVTD